MADRQSRFYGLYSGDSHAEPSHLQAQEQSCEGDSQEIHESLNTVLLRICISKRISFIEDYSMLLASGDDDSNYLINLPDF